MQQYSQFDFESLIRVLDFFHTTVNLHSIAVSITDYENGSCVYISPTFKNITGFSSAEFKENGMNWFVSKLHADDRKNFKINFAEGFLFLINTPTEQKLSCSFNLTTRLVHKKGYPIWLYKQCRPLALDKDGKPLLSLNIMTDITDAIPKGSKPCWSVYEQSVLTKPVLLGGSCNAHLSWLFGSSISPLSTREKQIVKLFMKGIVGKEVASQLNISTNTVHTHRKSILRKVGAKNMTEAITLALQNNWLHE